MFFQNPKFEDQEQLLLVREMSYAMQGSLTRGGYQPQADMQGKQGQVDIMSDLVKYLLSNF